MIMKSKICVNGRAANVSGMASFWAAVCGWLAVEGIKGAIAFVGLPKAQLAPSRPRLSGHLAEERQKLFRSATLVALQMSHHNQFADGSSRGECDVG